jgi:hypothetical protein
LHAFFGELDIRTVIEKTSLRLLELRYSSPQWLAWHNLYLVLHNAAYGSPTLGLKFQRRVPWGEDSIIRFALIGNLQGVKEMLYSGRSSIDDIDPNHGRTALHVSF